MGTKIEERPFAREEKQDDDSSLGSSCVSHGVCEKVLYQGFLEKRSDFWRSWRSRYFSLRLIDMDDETEQGSIYLYYWMSKERFVSDPNKPRGVFHMNYVKLRVVDSNTIALYTRLISSGEKMEVEPLALLRAHDAESARIWMRFFAYAHLIRSYPSLESLHTGEYNVNGESYEIEVKRRSQKPNKILLFMYRIHENEVPDHVCDLKYADGISKLINGRRNETSMFQILNVRDLMSRFQSADIQKLYNNANFHIFSSDAVHLVRLRLTLLDCEPQTQGLHSSARRIQRLFREKHLPDGRLDRQKHVHRATLDSAENGISKIMQMRNFHAGELIGGETSQENLSLRYASPQIETSFETSSEALHLAETHDFLEFSSSSQESVLRSGSHHTWPVRSCLPGYASAFVPVRASFIPKEIQINSISTGGNET